MAMNLPTAADLGHRMPIVKYDSRAGRIFRVDRSDESGRWESNPVEITPVFQAVFDLEHLETGWLHFPTGGAPDIRTAKLGTPLPDKPSDKHRTGFRIVMLLGKQAGGDVREMAANAAVAIRGMDQLHDDYLAGLAANPGQLPVVKLLGTTSVTTKGKNNGQEVSSTNYQPIWSIVKWVPRPAELQAGAEHMPPAQGQQTQAQPQQPAPPPPPPPPPSPPPPPPPPPPVEAQPMASVEDDF